MNVTKAFYARQRQPEAFDSFYEGTVELAQTLQIGSPTLPRYRKASQRFDGGSQAHRFCEPKDFFRQQYYSACDLLLQELSDRFDQKAFVQPVVALELLLIKAANGENFDQVFQTVLASVYQDDLDFDKLKRQLAIPVDVIREAQPEVKKVTSIRTITEAMKSHAYRIMLCEVHKLLRLLSYCAEYNRYFGKVLFYSSTHINVHTINHDRAETQQLYVATYPQSHQG